MKLGNLIYSPEEFGIFNYRWENDKLYCNDPVDLSFKQLEELPFDFIYAPSFNCSYNKLKSLQGIPEKCNQLFANNNLLEEIDVLPKICKFIDVSENPLKEIPDFKKVEELFELDLKNLKEVSNWNDLFVVQSMNLSYSSIKDLSIFNDKKIESLYLKSTGIESVEGLVVELMLYLRGCKNLKTLKGLKILPITLIVRDCGEDEVKLEKEVGYKKAR